MRVTGSIYESSGPEIIRFDNEDTNRKVLKRLPSEARFASCEVVRDWRGWRQRSSNDLPVSA